jgi:hypothetical protein
VLTPAATEEELRRLAHKLEAKTDDLAPLLQDAAEADVAYRLAYARALLCAEGKTVGEREAEATILTEKYLTERKVTEAIADACRESVRSLRDQLSAVQSVNANLRHMTGLDR